MGGVDVLDLLRRNNEALRTNRQEAFLNSLSNLERDYLEAHLSIGLAKGVAKPMLLVSEDLNEVVETPTLSGSTWDAHRRGFSQRLTQGICPSALDELGAAPKNLLASSVRRLPSTPHRLCAEWENCALYQMIARAIDAGYSAVIVLSGILNDLRTQTQERLRRTLLVGTRKPGQASLQKLAFPH